MAYKQQKWMGLVVVAVLVFASGTTAMADNLPPVANAGGPYLWTRGDPLTLDGSMSYDPNNAEGDFIIWFHWDLNGDGNYSDVSTFNPMYTLAPVQCSAFFPNDRPYAISLMISDMPGATDAASTTVYANVPAPEPSTFVLLGIGAIGLLAYAWRRRRS